MMLFDFINNVKVGLLLVYFLVVKARSDLWPS